MIESDLLLGKSTLEAGWGMGGWSPMRVWAWDQRDLVERPLKSSHGGAVGRDRRRRQKDPIRLCQLSTSSVACGHFSAGSGRLDPFLCGKIKFSDWCYLLSGKGKYRIIICFHPNSVSVLLRGSDVSIPNTRVSWGIQEILGPEPWLRWTLARSQNSLGWCKWPVNYFALFPRCICVPNK